MAKMTHQYTIIEMMKKEFRKEKANEKTVEIMDDNGFVWCVKYSHAKQFCRGKKENIYGESKDDTM